MKVELIKEWATPFAAYMSSPPQGPKLFKWECQKQFANHWQLGSDNFYQVFQDSFQSPYSNRLWEGSRHSGKSVMLQFIEHNQDVCASMFRDLFNEKKDLGLRLNRFIFHCDQMLSEIKLGQPKIVDHYHDYRLLSVYLAFAFPAEHCIFYPMLFGKAGSKIGLRKAPESYEYDRFQKLAKGLSTVLGRMDLIKDAYPFEIDGNLMLVHDFYEFVGES